jgi:hypothetical protein
MRNFSLSTRANKLASEMLQRFGIHLEALDNLFEERNEIKINILQ